MTKRFLVSTFMFSLILVSFVLPSLLVPVNASEKSIEQKGLMTLNDVVEFDLAGCTVTSKEQPQDSFLSNISQERIRYTHEGNGSKLDAICTFTNGNLQRIQILENEDASQKTKPTTNVAEIAKDFLDNYQNRSENSLYGNLGEMLSNVDLSKDSTSVSGDMQLAVTTSAEYTTFKWKYILNGIEAPDKYIALRYENGQLKYFIDNWNSYTLGNTEITISQEEAIATAIERIKTCSMKAETEQGIFELNFNVTNAIIWETIFAPSTYVDKPHNEDLLKLYPMYHVWVSLDKFYPGNIYGFNVYVWADTGEICYVKERVVSMDPPAELVATFDESNKVVDSNSTDGETQSNSMQVTDTMVLAIGTILLIVFPLYLNKKTGLTLQFSLSKLRFLKTISLLCAVLSCSTLILTIPALTVNAKDYQGRATIWGSESDGSWNENIDDGSSWRKSWNETLQQQETAQFLADLFEDNGYNASNYQGDNGLGSSRDAILAQIEYNELNFERVAVVDFNHGNGLNGSIASDPDEFHYMFEDQDGTIIGEYWPGTGPIYENAVFDMNISQRTILGNNTFFTFISACNSAHFNETFYGAYDSQQGIIPGTDRARGMPYAWTHRIVDDVNPGNQINTNYNMSDDGYNDPDTGKLCYMGFFGGSAALNQTIGDAGPPYHWWLEHFFAYALTDDLTIIEALNDASNYFFGGDYDETPLYNNFTAIWPMYIDGEWRDSYQGWNFFNNGTLRVYGNGNIKLYQPMLNVTACDSLGNPLAVGVEIDDEYVGTTDISERVFATLSTETHSIEVTEPNGYTFQNITDGTNTYSSKSIGIPIESDLTLTAYFTQNPPPQQVPVNIVIDSTAVGDQYSRYHAFTADNPIPQTFWTGDWYNQNPGAIIGIASGSLHYETTMYLTEGYHNLEYAVSSFVGYWDATITVNGQQVASQSTDVYNHVTVQIFVTDNPPPTYTLSISYDGGGYTSPPSGQHQYSSGAQVPVTAYDSGYWEFTHWTLDANPYYQNPITVTMNSNHNLQAHFYYDEPPPPSYYVTIEAWGYYPPWTLMYQGGQYMQAGPQQFSAPPAYGGLPFYAWYHDGNYYYDLTIWVSIYSDTYLAALYSY